MSINTANLVSYWKADRAGEFKDSKSTNHGTINGATHTVDGKIGGGYSFDGSNDYVNTNINSNDDFIGETGFTISFWMKPDWDVGSGTGFDRLISKGGTHGASTTTFRFGQHHTDNAFDFQIASGNTRYVTDSYDTTSDKWYHVVGLWDKSNIQLYVDGELFDTIDVTNINSDNRNILIGAMYDSMSTTTPQTSTLYKGKLDEVAIWSTALSASEVTELYNSGTGKTYNPDTDEFEEQTLTNGLVSYWNFDTDATDLVSGNNGTLIGSVSWSKNGQINGASNHAGGSQNQGIQIPADSGFNDGSVTYSFWIKPDSLTSNFYRLIENAKVSGTGYSDQNIVIRMNEGGNGRITVMGTKDGTNNDYRIDVNNAITTTTDFSHVVVTWDNTNKQVSVYINGEFKQDATWTNGINRYSFPIRFGGSIKGFTTNIYKGLIDEPAIWNRALTSTEITALYNEDTGKTYDIGKNAFIDGDALKVGQVSYWKLDDNAAKVKDAHSINDGTVTGATYTATGKINGAYSFDGSDDYITTPAFLNGRSEFSISLWLKPEGADTRYIAFGSGSGSDQIYLDSTNRLQVDFASLASRSGLTSTASVTNSVWQNVVITFDGTNFNAYLNTVDITAGSFGTGGTVAQSSFTWGRSTAAFQGIIDEPSVWNRALTSTEITALYNSGNGLQYPYEVLGPIGYSNSVNGVTTYTKINGIEATFIVKFNGVA